MMPLIRRRGVRLAARTAISAVGSAWTTLRLELMQGERLAARWRGSGGLLLNVGCGPHPREGWINVDVRPSGPEVFYLDAVNGLPLDDGSVRHIHAEHFLEHLPVHDAIGFLRECRRVLEPGGVARIIVPDAEKYMDAYARQDRAFFERLADLGGAASPLKTPVEVCNQMFRMGGDHRFAWDFETLEHHAREADFAEVQRSSFGAMSAHLDIDGRDWWRPVESLYANLYR